VAHSSFYCLISLRLEISFRRHQRTIMKTKLIWAACILFPALAAPMNAQKTAPSSGPSLKETTSWIQDTILDGTYEDFKSPISNDANYVAYSAADFNACIMNITEWTTHENGRKEKISIIIPLAALDPGTIKSDMIVPPHARVYFATTNSKRLITLTLPNGQPGLVDSAFISTSEAGYAPRLTAALKHLVGLCGGQKSPF
jgi:hypothetical protein